MFPHIQEKELLKDVLSACRDFALWKWIAAAEHYVFTPLEKLRRWAMVCPSHARATQAERTEADQCNMKSRRLREAHAEANRVKCELADKARRLDTDSTEGCGDTREEIAAALRLSASELGMRFTYLSKPPWCFSNADAQSGAQYFLDEVNRIPLPSHDGLTRRLFTCFEEDLDALASEGRVFCALAR